MLALPSYFYTVPKGKKHFLPQIGLNKTTKTFKMATKFSRCKNLQALDTSYTSYLSPWSVNNTVYKNFST